MKLLQVIKVAPANSSAELTLPLTFLDLFYFKLRPTERLFFYKIPGVDSARFNDSILSKLKDSLALTLNHYLPFAGNILWPHSSHKPILCYRPGDAVSLSVYESSEANFDRLSGDNVRETAESRQLAPSLFVSHERVSVIALSITLFPNSGFCIGVSAHHSVLDGKSTTMFVKSWAHICKELENGESADPNLPMELSPVFDRAAIEENPEARGLDMVYLRQWAEMTENLSEGNPRSLMISPGIKKRKISNNKNDNIVSGTFELTPADIEKLRNKVMKMEDYVTRLSTFVLSTSYVLTHTLRAIMLTSPRDGTETETLNKAKIGFPVDYRARLGVPLPGNYIGNCVAGHMVEVEESDGFERLAAKLSEAIGELDKGVLRNAVDRLSNMVASTKYTSVWVTGSVRLGVYGADFGWGGPKKVMTQSNDLSGGVSLAERRDGSGGVELGVVLTKLQMQHFQASFRDGLNSL